MGEAVRIGVAGALGWMGRAIEALAAGRDDVGLCARLDRPGATDAAAHAIAPSDFDAAAKVCDVIIDFSTAAASASLAAGAGARGGPAVVIGATGFSPAEDAQVHEAAQRIAIVRAGNLSLGVNLLAALVEEAARRLPTADWDIEILETHHRRKIDAPSARPCCWARPRRRGEVRRWILTPWPRAPASPVSGPAAAAASPPCVGFGLMSPKPRLENGRRNPTVIVLYELAQVLGASHVELVMPDGEEKKPRKRGSLLQLTAKKMDYLSVACQAPSKSSSAHASLNERRRFRSLSGDVSRIRHRKRSEPAKWDHPWLRYPWRERADRN